MEKEITIFELISNLVYKICKGDLDATFFDNSEDRIVRISIPKLNIFFETSKHYGIQSGEVFFLTFNSSNGSEKILLERSIQNAMIDMFANTIRYLKQISYQKILKEIGGTNGNNNND